MTPAGKRPRPHVNRQPRHRRQSTTPVAARLAVSQRITGDQMISPENRAEFEQLRVFEVREKSRCRYPTVRKSDRVAEEQNPTRSMGTGEPPEEASSPRLWNLSRRVRFPQNLGQFPPKLRTIERADQAARAPRVNFAWSTIAPPIASDGPRILVIEDEPLIAQMIEEMLGWFPSSQHRAHHGYSTTRICEAQLRCCAFRPPY